MKTLIYEYNDPDGHRFSPYYVCDTNGWGCYEMTVDIPDVYQPYISSSGDVILQLGDMRYMLSECLRSSHGNPALFWYDGHKEHWHALKVSDRYEKSTALYL